MEMCAEITVWLSRVFIDFATVIFEIETIRQQNTLVRY